jgi:hypothetical protein
MRGLAASEETLFNARVNPHSLSDLSRVHLFAASPLGEKPDQQDQERNPANPPQDHPSALPVAIHMIHESTSCGVATLAGDHGYIDPMTRASKYMP